ncbi:histone deacetylase, putative [Leishmania tarentolae]|uniref:Histone deacetylase, putative n=1 Tax=Leishmania tarentolae TaxID=5689 RepID=A0A640KGN6_LEITA|nr:histone deacetylase, putative [Leishmania tarentolae]
MPKRQRSDEKAVHHVELSVESGRRFDAYIRGWLQGTIEQPCLRPSLLPPLTPLPTLATLSKSAAAETRERVSAAATAGESSPLFEWTPPRTVLPSSSTAVVYDNCMLDHISPDAGDYERPARLESTLDHLTAIGLLACCQRIPARTAKTSELRRVHCRELIDTIDQLDFFMGIQEGRGSVIGQDLFASEHTSRAARMAAGCVIEAVRAVLTGTATNAFALIRPPGHHAGPANAAGFCLYNNVAVAARAAQAELVASPSDQNPDGDAQKPRILILDWDVHHCDGTESIFYNDPSVLVISLHQYGKGQGHVLRKVSSVASKQPVDTSTNKKEDITADDLAALLSPGAVEPPPVSVPEASCPEAASALPQSLTEGRRARAAVDYNKLAAQIEDDDDAEIAALFGVDLNAVSSSSNSSSAFGSPSTNADNTSVEKRSTHPVNYPGDTVGLSFDETSLQRYATGTEEEEPFYPGTGHLNRVGGDTAPAAQGRNINIPWPTHGMGDLEYLQLLHEVVLPVAHEFRPELVLISCGFDSASGDLLGSMRLTPSGYYIMTRLMTQNFPRLVVALEGGYNVRNVALCSEAVLRALLETSGCPSHRLPKTRMLWCQASSLVSDIKRMHAPYWNCFSQNMQGRVGSDSQ